MPHRRPDSRSLPFLPHHARSVRLIAVSAAVMVVGCCAVGCRNAADPPAATMETVDGMAAEPFLRSVFARYRAAESYRDSGQVRLSLERNGRLQTEEAPMEIWFDRNELYLQAYDVRITSNGNQFTAWINDPTTGDFDSQVVRTTPIEGRPAVNDLLSDGVLSDRLTAGLAGPPPQLEWLFAAEPMRRLFEDDYKIQFAPPRPIKGRMCLTVEVRAGDDHYRFCIDKTEGVIRRVDLPPILLPPEFHSDLQPEEFSRIMLTLELENATFESPEQAAAIAELPSRPRFVKYFVPLPPAPPAETLGQYPAPFSTRDQSGQVQLSHRGSDRDLTVLVFADGQASQFSASLITPWQSMMQADLQQRIRVGIVTDEAGFRLLPRDLGLPVFVDHNGEIANALAVKPGSLVVLQGDGRIGWLQAGVSSESVMQLGPIVGDLLDGVNVPQRMRQQWDQDRGEYQRALETATIRTQR